MKPSERIAKSRVTPITGLFAMLCGLRPSKGSGASSSRGLLLLLPFVLVSLLLAAAPAFAAEVHVNTLSFGGAGSEAGQFKEPQGVAVNDETGDVYVVDKGNNRVEWFSAAGVYEGEFNGTGLNLNEKLSKSPAPLSKPEWIAVDNYESSPSYGDVYVTDNGHKVIDKFSPTGAYLGQVTGSCDKEGETPPSCSGFTGFTELEGIAVDTAGELWVEQQAVGTYEGPTFDNYSDAAANVFLAGRGGPTDHDNGPSPGFAVGPEDDLYEISQGLVVRLTSEGGGVSEPVGPHSTPTGLAVDPSNNDLYVDEANGVVVIDAADEAKIEEFGSENLSAGTGIAVNSSTGSSLSNSVYVADTASDTVKVFDYVDIPLVTTEPASNVEIEREAGHAAVSATLHGEVEPGGVPVTSCKFEYGTTTAYGHSAPCAGSIPDTGETSVTATIPSLLPDSTYHFRLVAANKNDENDPTVIDAAAGHDQTFPTPGPSIAAEAPATEVKARTAALAGEVDPGGLPLSKCEFEYGSKAEFESDGVYEHSAPCVDPDAAEIGEGTGPVKVHAPVSGLSGATTYVFRLVATTEVFATKEHVTVTGPGREFLTSPLAVLAGERAEDVTASGAELQATVNPEGLPVTRCQFEYGTSTSYGQVVRCAQKDSAIGAGAEPVPVSAQLDGLEANTTYHWRLVVRDEPVKGEPREAVSPDHTFIAPTTGVELPDHRAYEMVTPVQKNGGLIGDIFTGVEPSIAEDGSRVIASDIQCFEPAESCNADRETNGEPFEFTRTAEAGQCAPATPPCWKASALAPPAQMFSNTENTPWAANANEGAALFSMPTGPAEEDEWYARSAAGSFAAIGPATPPGVTGVNPFGNPVKHATADLSHVVWEEEGDHWPFDKTTGTSVYEYAGAHNRTPLLVGVAGESGSTDLISACETTLGIAATNSLSWDALSADGRTVYFLAHACGGGSGAANEHTAVPADEIYARVDGEEPGAAHTVAISQPDAPEVLTEGARGYANPPDGNCTTEECQKDIGETKNWRVGEFAGASADGSMAFFLDTQQLTDAATQGTGSAGADGCAHGGTDCNLYLYDFNQPAGHNLIDVSAPEAGGEGGGGPRVQGVLAISADGSHVYFAAQGVLSSAPNAQGQSARSGRENLYVYERDARYPEGHTAFIASLTVTDSFRDWIEQGNTRSNVTPEGRFLVFESRGDLTPAEDPTNGSQQIYRYDAETEQLIRISIGEDGFDDDGNASPGDATIVEPKENEPGPVRGDPTMSNDGAYVFFQSPAALTPHALNGSGQNVYEWHAGHVYLISDGRDTSTAKTPCLNETGSSDVCLLGTDATGANVFFMTSDQLVPKDTDTQVDIYDARICEPEHGNPCVTEPTPPLPPCLGEQCHGIPAATPSLLAPGTASFNGEGNLTPPPPAVVKPKSLTKAQKLADALKACKKKPKKQRSTCEKKAKKQYGAAKKSSRKKGE